MKFYIVAFAGTVGSEPDFRTTITGKEVVSLSVAVNDPYRDFQGNLVDRTYWFRVIAWSALARFAGNNLHKGSQAIFSGKLTSRSYIDASGSRRSIVEIIATDIQQISKKAGSEDNKSTSEDIVPKFISAYDAAKNGYTFSDC